MQSSVQILLATYNGERFLQQQLDSLFRQTYQDFTVLIRDDGSSDNTLQIIETYRQQFPGKIILITDDKKNVGATQNFNLLLEKSTADSVFFCDQDDVWLPEKIEKSLAALRMTAHNPSIPCVVYADMKSIDEENNITAASVWQQLQLHPKYFTLNRLLVQNIPHGCTMLINKAMRNLAYPIPKDAILHDHWIALLASACGKAQPIEEPLLLLRNHSENVTRKQTSVFDKLRRFAFNSISKSEYEHFIKIRVRQAKALLERVHTHLSKENRELLENFIVLEKSGSIRRKKIFIRYKFYRTTFWHTFKMIFRS